MKNRLMKDKISRLLGGLRSSSVWQVVRMMVGIYLMTVLLFALQKFGFVALNYFYAEEFTLVDMLTVVWHGLRLDMVAASYLMTVPLLLLLATCMWQRLPLRKLLTIWYALSGVLVMAAFVGDAMLYRSWGAKLDFFDLTYAANPHDVFANFTWWVIVIGVAAFGLLVAAYCYLLRWVTPKRMPLGNRRWRTIVVVLLMMGLNVLGMRGSLQESTANPGYAYFSQRQFLNHAALNPFFNVIHSMGKYEDLTHEFEFYDEAELQQLTAGIYDSYPEIADTLLNTNRPNIILIVWEGGGSLMTDDSVVAPNMAQFKKEGVYFANCYANNFRTDRGLVSLLSGWPGLPTTSVMKMSGKCRQLPGFARSLKGEGYHTQFYYGGDVDFTNMRGYLYDIGYEYVEGMAEHKSGSSEELTVDKWGIHDEYLLSRDYCSYPEAPWMVTCLTLSSHEPWTVPYRRLEADRENSFAYTDSCIGAFMKELRDSEIWDNLLVVIVPDHGVARHGESLGNVAVAKIPMLWIGGAVKESKRVDVLMNQTDIAATILAQLGISAEDYPFSRNVLSKEYSPSVVMHAFKNGLNLIDVNGSSHFDCVDGEVVSAGELHEPDAQQKAKALLQLIYQRTGEL